MKIKIYFKNSNNSVTMDFESEAGQNFLNIVSDEMRKEKPGAIGTTDVDGIKTSIDTSSVSFIGRG